MTEYSTQLCLQIPPPALRQAYLPKSHSQQFSLLIRTSTRPMGTESWQCFHAAFCTQYFVICFWGRAVGYGLNIALLVSKIYITLKVVIISDICWHILGKPSKHMERNTVNKIAHPKEPRHHRTKVVSICLQPKGFQGRANLCCHFLLPMASEKQGTRTWKDRKISLGSVHAGQHGQQVNLQEALSALLEPQLFPRCPKGAWIREEIRVN